MACTAMEAGILEYPELGESAQKRIRAHASQCSACQDLLDAAMDLDAHLRAAVRAPQRFQRKVLAKMERRPSYLPELFDFVGWAAMITVAVGLIQEFLATSPN